MWKSNGHIKKNVPGNIPERWYDGLIVPVKGDVAAKADVAVRADAVARVVAVPAQADVCAYA